MRHRPTRLSTAPDPLFLGCLDAARTFLYATRIDRDTSHSHQRRPPPPSAGAKNGFVSLGAGGICPCLTAWWHIIRFTHTPPSQNSWPRLDRIYCGLRRPVQGQTGPSEALSGTSKYPLVVSLRAGAYLVNAKPAVGLTVVSLPTRRRRSGRGESSDH